MNHLSNMYKKSSDQSLLFRLLMTPLNWVYRALVSLHFCLYRWGFLKSQSLPGVCISVGNLSVGGTGKSPIVCEILELLIKQGAYPVVLTRGYGSDIRDGDALLFKDGKLVKSIYSSAYKQFPDEALMQSTRFPSVPVLVGKRRWKSALWYLQFANPKPTHWILDDGFQHHQIKKDLDIVLLDAKHPFGNGYLLPLGTLREDISALQRAHAVIFTRCEGGFPEPKLVDGLIGLHPQLSVMSAEFGSQTLRGIDGSSQTTLMSLAQSRASVLLVCGVAQPERILDQLQNARILVSKSYFQPDHRAFDRQKLLSLHVGCTSIITTSKDFFRNPKVFENLSIPVFILILQVHFLNNSQERLAALLNPVKISQ